MTEWPLARIRVGRRFRKDLGDLRALAASIDDVGLLHPVVVTPQGRLIAGRRRLEAVRLLGRSTVAVHVVDLANSPRTSTARTSSPASYGPSPGR